MNKMATIPNKIRISRRDLRQNRTPAEELLWEMLRGAKLDGLKFRRQHQLGNFIADFYCADLRLAIELDGGVHKKTIEQDRARDEAVARHNVPVVRLKNEEILGKPEEKIRKKIRDITLGPSPKDTTKVKNRVSSPSPGYVERDGEARVRSCELCGRPIRANQPVLAIASGKVYTDKRALALKNTQFICHVSCWNQIENEDI